MRSRRKRKTRRLLGHEPLAIGDLILTEVLQGFDNDVDFHDARRLLTSLTVSEIGGPEITIPAAKNFRVLAQARRHRSQDDRHHDCHPMHRERI